MRSATDTRSILLVAAIAGCSSPHPVPSGPDASVSGDGMPGAPEIELVYRTPGGAVATCAADASVPLTVPPQGGFVLLVSVRARHLDPTSVVLTASIRDTVDDQVVSLEQRPVGLVVGADGWSTPEEPSELVNWANLPVCPSASATRDLFDQPYMLRIAVEDDAGATAEAKLTVVPTCDPGADGAFCRCQCAQGYMLGDPCP